MRYICIASGPSLTAEDCGRARGLPVIVTNSTFRACPWADWLFFFDPPWWRVHSAEVRATFTGHVVTQALSAMRGVECARRNLRFKSFGNAGANAIAWAIALGASEVVMLGYDCALTGGQAHHHGDHPVPLRNCDTLPRWPAQFARLAEWADRRGARVVNASRSSALDCFPRVSLEDALR